jgi:hypothetical protein
MWFKPTAIRLAVSSNTRPKPAPSRVLTFKLSSCMVLSPAGLFRLKARESQAQARYQERRWGHAGEEAGKKASIQ